MVVKMVSVIFVLVLAATLSGCYKTDKEQIEEQAEVVKACVEKGGEWYYKDSWSGSWCYFDARKDDNG